MLVAVSERACQAGVALGEGVDGEGVGAEVLVPSEEAGEALLSEPSFVAVPLVLDGPAPAEDLLRLSFL